MAIERRAVKKRVLKSGADRTDTAVYVLLKYGISDNPDTAYKLVTSKDEVLFPSDLSYYNDQVDQDLGMGKTSPEVEKIRNALAEFYGLYEPEEETEEEVPSELDDLLGSIREEELEEPSAPPSSALAIYEGVGGEDIVDEEIDERILKLLKLDGVHDIDYATYLTLLKERMVAGRMADSSMPTEEIELLTDEYKRVKGKVGRFKLKKKRITAEDMGTAGPVTVSDDQFFLASSAVIPGKTADGETEDDSEVLKKLDDILNSLRMENKEERKKTKSDKKDAEAERRRKREKKLEAKKNNEFKSLIKTVVAPVTSLLEKILNWIKWTFIGFIFNQALAWFQDPANKEKVEAIGAFLKAFFPSILAAAVLFLTPFGAFIRSTIKLFRWAIPKMLGIIKKNPKLFTAAALVGAGAMIPQMFPETVNEQERKIAEAGGTNAEKIAKLKEQKENLSPLQIIQGVGSEIDEQIKFLETGESASYGAAPGGRVQTSRGGASNADNKDLDEMPTIEGMSGGGLVDGTIINTYNSGGAIGKTINMFSGGGAVGKTFNMFNGGGLVSNAGGSYNNYNTLDSQGTFNPIFGFTGGGINLPNVTVPNMNANISLMSGGGFTNISSGGATTNISSGGSSNSVMNVNSIRFTGGGGVTNETGVDITGAGPDTQLVALQPGEIVMSKSAVNHWGASTLLGMNKAGGGTNVPKMANNIQMAAGGGMVGAPLSGGGTTSLDPTKTAASMPHVFAAAKAARAQARAEGLPPEEVERRVIQASEQAKLAVPGAVTGPTSTPGLPKSPQYNSPGGSPFHEPLSESKNKVVMGAGQSKESGGVPSPVETAVNVFQSQQSFITKGGSLDLSSQSIPIMANLEQMKMSSEMSSEMITADKFIQNSSFNISNESLPSVITSGDIGMTSLSNIYPQNNVSLKNSSMSSSNIYPQNNVSLKNSSMSSVITSGNGGSMPSTPFKSQRLNKALTGIKPGAWKSRAKTPNLSPMDYSGAIKTSSPSVSMTVKTTPSQSMEPVATPIGNTKPNIIQLPTTTSSAAPPMQSQPSTPDIPKFSASKNTGKRSTTLNALGIADLVG